jgi:molybdopterin synthase sulfur carrier subunit
MRDSTDTAAIVVEVVYLARLREAFGCAGEALPVTSAGDACVVADVLATLAGRGGAFAAELAAGRALRVAVNHTMAGRDTPVRQGDEVALFPPVTGG